MSHITDNKTAWLTAKGARPLQVGPGPVPNPAKNEVVIKVAYAAINPVDGITQKTPYVDIFYPSPLGQDVAGTIVALGSEVTQFAIGQRVTGHCDGLLSKKADHFAFQSYATCLEVAVCPIPDSVPLANAAVLPLAVDTASTGLFHVLKLPLPTINPKPAGHTVLIWGGSSSVGSCAIQLALASGFNVATTASAKNHEYVKSLGAQHAFDYNDPDVVDKIAAFLKPGDLVFDCIGGANVQALCEDILHKIGGGTLPTVLYPVPSKYDNVKTEFVMGLVPAMVDTTIGETVWHQYLPEALRVGKFQAKPEPHLIQGGLERVQDGIDLLAKGVSATKIVIEVAQAA